MTWNYRLVKHSDNYLYFHEIYYDKDGSPRAIAEEPEQFLSAESIEDMQDILQKFTKATKELIFIPPKSWEVDL